VIATAALVPSHPAEQFVFHLPVGNFVFQHCLAVELDRNVVVLTNHFLGVPDVVGDGRRVEEDDILAFRGG
jgi:hypothetical protein